MMTLKESYNYLDKNVEIIKELNSGSFGTVYLISDATKDMFIALKIILIDNEQKEYKFIKESEIQLQMKDKESAYVLKTYYSGLLQVVPEKFKAFKKNENDKLGIIGMEYVEGGDLFEGICSSLLEINSDLVKQKLNLFLHVCKGVQFLHENRIVHGDIKLENILCTMKGNNTVLTKLIDFDWSMIIPEMYILARNIDYDRGTVFYNPPELYHLKILGYCADIWALGCLFYVLFFKNIMYDDYVYTTRMKEITDVVAYVMDFDFSDKKDKPNPFYDFVFGRFEKYYEKDCELLYGLFESMCNESFADRIKIDDLIEKVEDMIQK
jgi:serine/threonine protein kinase